MPSSHPVIHVCNNSRRVTPDAAARGRLAYKTATHIHTPTKYIYPRGGRGCRWTSTAGSYFSRALHLYDVDYLLLCAFRFLRFGAILPSVFSFWGVSCFWSPSFAEISHFHGNNTSEPPFLAWAVLTCGPHCMTRDFAKGLRLLQELAWCALCGRKRVVPTTRRNNNKRVFSEVGSLPPSLPDQQ